MQKKKQKKTRLYDQLYWDTQAKERKPPHSVYLAGGATPNQDGKSKGNQDPHDCEGLVCPYVREQNGDMYDVRCTFYDNQRSEEEKEADKVPENQACPPKTELEKDQDQEKDQENQDQEMDLQLLYPIHDTKEPEK